jgi:hypothetical protein
MVIQQQQLRNVLALIAVKIHYIMSETVADTWIIDHTPHLPKEKTRRYLNELQSLHMIRIDQQVNGTDKKGRKYKMVGITEEAIKELASFR